MQIKKQHESLLAAVQYKNRPLAPSAHMERQPKEAPQERRSSRSPGSKSKMVLTGGGHWNRHDEVRSQAELQI